MNIGKVIAGALRDVAPSVAGAVLNASPGGAIVRQVAEAVTGRNDATDAELMESLADLTPEQVERIRILEDHETQRIQASFEDISNARAMQIATGDSAPERLAYLDTALVVSGVVAIMYFQPANEFVQTIVSAAMGALLANMRQARDFIMGSSLGSKIKTMQQGSRKWPTL